VSPARRRRHAAAAAAFGLLAPLLLAGPAYAANGDYGDPAPLSRTVVVLVFVGIPLALILLVAALTLRQRGVGALQYRPGRPWGFARQWFGDPPPETTAQPRMSVPGLGGASARW